MSCVKLMRISKFQLRIQASSHPETTEITFWHWSFLARYTMQSKFYLTEGTYGNEFPRIIKQTHSWRELMMSSLVALHRAIQRQLSRFRRFRETLAIWRDSLTGHTQTIHWLTWHLLTIPSRRARHRLFWAWMIQACKIWWRPMIMWHLTARVIWCSLKLRLERHPGWMLQG